MEIKEICDTSKYDISIAKNPLDITEDCKLYTSIKQKYYIHTYDPKPIIDEISRFPESSYKTDMLRAINEICDLVHQTKLLQLYSN